jgi:hypothetical protein
MSGHPPTLSEQNFNRMRQLAAQLARSVSGPAPTRDNVENWSKDFAALEKAMKLYTDKNKNMGIADVIKNVAKATGSWSIYRTNPNPTDKRAIVAALTAVSNANYVKPS